MQFIGKILIIFGILIIIAGLIFVFHEHIPFLGKLHGDIIIKKGNLTFYFPFVTFLVISILLTIIINIVLRILGK